MPQMPHMISTEDARALIQASFYFNELFKKAVLANDFPLSVTKTQMDLLMALYAEGPMNMSALSAKVYIAPEQATRAINGLRGKGLVESERSESNRRMVIARLTEKGALVLDDHLRDQHTALQAALEGLDPDEVHELAQAASRIAQLFRKTGFKYILPGAEKGN